ncbi:MAG: ABC transporter permease [Lewinellaceae bacterium]|nr:ABC transporter permease [Lewinellaceae bacterium]
MYPPERRERLYQLTARSGNWNNVCEYDHAVANFARALDRLPDTLAQKTYLQPYLRDLLYQSNPIAIDTLLQASIKLLFPAEEYRPIISTLDTLSSRNQAILHAPFTWKSWLPAFYWNGSNNQYHDWIKGFLSGDLGISSHGRPVASEIMPRLYITLSINGMAVLLSILLGIPLGVALSRRNNTSIDRWGNGTLLFLYSLPVFWVGGLLMMWLATPGQGLHLIKGVYIDPWNSQTSTYLQYVARNASKFILPVLTLTLHLIAIITLQMRGSMIGVMHHDYIRTARAKGLREGQVYWRHGFRNALFPMITLLAEIIPFLFTGSLVVESMFQFPGLGMKTTDAFISRDYPVLFAILMMIAFITVLSQLLGDLLYAWADPRVRFNRK